MSQSSNVGHITSPRPAQMDVRSALAGPRQRLGEIERMLHDAHGDVCLPQAESWARELEDFAQRLARAATMMRAAARCGGRVPGRNSEHLWPCRYLVGHAGHCVADIVERAPARGHEDSLADA